MAMQNKRLNLLNDETQRLNVFDLEKAEPLFVNDADMPSGRVFQGKNGKRAINGLRYIEEECNCSWYHMIRERWEGCDDNEAIFYRGNSIPAKVMFAKAEEFTRALLATGVRKGDEIACCISNVPELLYIMLGANRIGVKLNFFGSHYDPVYIRQILADCSDKLFIATDNEFEKIEDLIEGTNFQYKVLISLADSLPENLEECEEYEPELDAYYHYENSAVKFAERDADVMLFADYLALGKDYDGDIVDDNDLDTEFLITYTSGSTKIGFPKRMYHRNRGLITVGVFHDPKWCGNPAAKGLRGLALIHTDSNTNLVTSISDSLFQNWSVAMEPEYDKDLFLDCLFVDKPNVAIATTTFLLETASQYLIDQRFHNEDGKGRKLGFLLAVMAVGEVCAPGEEKFINEFLKESKAGSDVKLLGPFHFNHVTVGQGGGDTEHGGIYYTLWRATQQKLNGWKLHGDQYGMKPVPYAQVACLRKTSDGSYVECGYNEYGVIVANCASAMAGYKYYEKVKSKIITDSRGIDWVSCDVFGYIDTLGCVHVKDRSDSAVTLEDGTQILPFQIVDEVQRDPANVLTAVVTTCKDMGKIKFVVNVEFSPLKEHPELQIIQDMDRRLKREFPEIADRFLYRKFDHLHPFPITGSGKRSVVGVQNLGPEYAYRFRKDKMFPTEG